MHPVAKGLVAVVTLWGISAVAQESEFKKKLQEDLDGYQAQIESSCAIKPKLEWGGGKLGHNPRESEKPEYTSIVTLCTSALSAVSDACSNEVVKKELSKVKTVKCTKGKGTLAYTLKGGTLTLTIDPAYAENNAAGQTTVLTDKLKASLDK